MIKLKHSKLSVVNILNIPSVYLPLSNRTTPLYLSDFFLKFIVLKSHFSMVITKNKKKILVSNGQF